MTKSMITLLVVAWCTTHSAAQVCSFPQSQIDLHGNNIKARILNGGDLFWDFSDGQFIPNPTPGGNDPATIFSAALWIGGVDPGGNLKLSAVTYRNNGTTDYWPGPLDPATGTTANVVCANWDRIFKVTGAQIAAFQAALPNLQNNPGAAISQFPSVMGWPAKGNPYFADIWGFDLPFTTQALAGFHDANGDGSYDPLEGDFPAVELRGLAPFVADEFVWCVFNDQGGGAPHPVTNGSPFQMEVQLTAWAFNCPDQPVISNTVFTSHKMIYRGADVIDSVFIGLYVDPDIGCYTDDFMGCNPGLSTFYAYNQDAVDGSPGATCSGAPTFGDNPPVQSVTLLSKPMDRFIGINNAGVGTPPAGTTDPDAPVQFYNYLTGHWRDGSPLTYGGNGYQTGNPPIGFYFPDDPTDPNGWSMCTANLPSGDRRGLAISRPGFLFSPEGYGKLQPGQVDELVTAWTVHPNADLPCGLGNTFDEIQSVRAAYNNAFDGVCLSSGTQQPGRPDIGVYPNPANTSVTLKYGDWQVKEIRLLSTEGRLVKTIRNTGLEQTEVSVSDLPNGFYLAELLGEGGSWMVKVTVLH